VYTLGAGTDFRISLLPGLAINFGFDIFQVLGVHFKLQAVLFFHLLDGISIYLSDEFIGLSQQLLDILGFHVFIHDVAFLLCFLFMISNEPISLSALTEQRVMTGCDHVRGVAA